ncbi:MAG: hypothetical protein N2489_02140 [Clostridia bacterium]|nr:hypothetical protein [Clostridia bacterium]
MKFIAYMFLGVFFISVILSPAVELLGIFTDKMRIDAALTAASSAAVLTNDDYNYTRDVESAIIYDDFEHRFRESFRDIFDLDLSYASRDGRFNRFHIKITPQYRDREDNQVKDKKDSAGRYVYNECTIRVSTEYKLKTGLMKNYYEKTGKYSPFIITRTKRQTLTITN